MEINKAELLHYVQVYANNVEIELGSSTADMATKLLVRNVAEQTSALLAAIINAIRD